MRHCHSLVTRRPCRRRATQLSEDASMRLNLPVSRKEYTLRPSMLIVSRTDLKGRIAWVNEDFIEASGYAECELIGQPHNLLRHPKC